MLKLLLVPLLISSISCAPQKTQDVKGDEQQRNLAQKKNVPKEKQIVPPLFPYYGQFPVLEPQFQYPGYNFVEQKQFPRLQPQPQIVFYGHGGQGQPILINPGSPPGNFLIPQPGPNVIIRDTPQRPPVFVAGYPKPAHIPPIEKDAEEVPTNPARIPPLSSGGRNKPEKLETFNDEGKPENPRLAPIPNELKPGQRFFILNGEQLYQNNFPYQDLDELQQQRQAQFAFQNVEIAPKFNQLEQQSQQLQQQPVFRSALPLPINFNNINPVNPQLFGQFRFTPPSDPYFSIGSEDVENDSVVINADEKLEKAQGNNEDSQEPSTAQAAPGAVALAGPGGVAGASPRATALVGKGGLAVSSPHATAIAGPKEEKKEPGESEKNKAGRYRYRRDN